MSYRDEGDALQAKVGKLEGDLAAAEAKIARLEGRAPAVQTEPSERSWIGAPTSIALVAELDHEIDADGYEAIAAVARERFGVQVAQVGRSLHAGSFLSITRAGDKTVVRVAAAWKVLRAGPISAGALSGIFGGLISTALLHDLAHASPATLLAHATWIVPSLALGVGWLARGRAKRLAEQNVERYRGLFETVLELAERHAIREPAARARVAVEDSDLEAELAADAIEEARRHRA